MSDDNSTYPYILTVFPSRRFTGYFDWAIRKGGTLVQRADLPHPSEQSARQRGEAALDRQFRADREPRRSASGL